jgi:hypothetical protein
MNWNISRRVKTLLVRSDSNTGGVLHPAGLFVAALLLAVGSSLHAQSAPPMESQQTHTDAYSDPEGYKFRVEGEFWYATPTGTIAGSTTEAPIDFTTVLHFQTYATASAGADWHFKRKHHLFLLISPNKADRSITLQQTITFRGYTFEEGTGISSQVTNNVYAPGYRYDILHREHGHLGIVAQFNLLDIHASIKGEAITGSGTQIATASASLLAPIPVLGPDARIYFLRNRAFADGNVKGMYFFGYGNYITAQGQGGFRFGKHIDLTAGYQMGSHLVINGNNAVAANSRLSIRETQRGFTTGLEFNF